MGMEALHPSFAANPSDPALGQHKIALRILFLQPLLNIGRNEREAAFGIVFMVSLHRSGKQGVFPNPLLKTGD
jgi:hypothetical protein